MTPHWQNGRYHYYACSIRTRQGDTGRKGRTFSHGQVGPGYEERLLEPERLRVGYRQNHLRALASA